jgi:hypothetical protein
MHVRADFLGCGCTNGKPFDKVGEARRQHGAVSVVRGDSWLAICCATSSLPLFCQFQKYLRI